jgi:hypothetical protein
MRSWIGLAVLLAGTSFAANVSPVSTKPSPLAPRAAAAREERATRPELFLPRGTALHVRIDESVDTRRTRPGYVFHATLPEPLVRNGETLLPRGTRFAAT